MLVSLDKKKKEKVNKAFCDHPLFEACNNVFKRRAAHLNGVDVSSEELFCAVASVLDEVFLSNDITQQQVDDIWTDVCLELRKKKTDTTENDKVQVAHTVFAIVRKLMCHHWNGYYCFWVYGLMGETIQRETSGADEDERALFLERLSDFSTELDEWINQDYDGHLLSEIVTVFPSGRGTRGQSTAFSPTGQTFTKTSLLLEPEIDIICKYLTINGKLEDGMNPDTFRKLFSGVDSFFTIKWLGKEGELRDLFQFLIGGKGKDVYIKPKRGYLQILRSHFKDAKGNEFINLKGAKSIESFMPVIDNIMYLLNRNIHQCVEAMRELIEERQEMLEELGYSNKFHPSADLHVSKNKKYPQK